MHVREYVEQVIFHEVGQETFEKKKHEQSLEQTTILDKSSPATFLNVRS